MRFLFLVFIIVPLIEITVLINVGQVIGAWYTVGLVLLSAFIGVNMLRFQGLSTLTRARMRMDSGEIPANEMIEGLILAVGGALLITPGFVTDFFGFCCLIPITRQLIVLQLKKHFTVVASARQGGFQQADVNMQNGRANPSETHRSMQQGDVIDGEYRRDD